MALNIKYPEADRLAREPARRRGESITDAVLAASSLRASAADDVLGYGDFARADVERP